MSTIPIAKPDDVSGVKAAQPYTIADLELGRKLVRQLHGVGSGFDAWAEHLAKAIVAERTASSERIRVLSEALEFYADPHGKCDQVPDFYNELCFGDRARAALQRPTQSTRILKCLECHRVFVDCNQCPVCNAKLSTQSTREQGEAWKALEEIANCDGRDGMVLSGYEAVAIARDALKNKPQQGEAPGAEAIEQIARTLAYEEWPHATPDERAAWVNKHWDDQEYLRVAKAVAAIRQPAPVPAPGVMVTLAELAQQMRDVADNLSPTQHNYPANVILTWACTIAALSVALRPKEPRVVDEIAAERGRQVESEGWTLEHDDKHTDRSLSRAAACYAMRRMDREFLEKFWPWGSKWWKPSTQRRDLIKAGALIVAEIERLDRAALRPKE